MIHGPEHNKKRNSCCRIAPIRSIPDENANKEFFIVKPGNLVYHTITMIIMSTWH